MRAGWLDESSWRARPGAKTSRAGTQCNHRSDSSRWQEGRLRRGRALVSSRPERFASGWATSSGVQSSVHNLGLLAMARDGDYGNERGRSSESGLAMAEKHRLGAVGSRQLVRSRRSPSWARAGSTDARAGSAKRSNPPYELGWNENVALLLSWASGLSQLTRGRLEPAGRFLGQAELPAVEDLSTRARALRGSVRGPTSRARASHLALGGRTGSRLSVRRAAAALASKTACQQALRGHRLTSRWRRPRDLREWIALLEREGELVRVAAEVDPYLEVTEIVDRTVRADGPALLFEKPEGRVASAPDQPVRHRAPHVPRVRRRAASTTRPRSSAPCSRCSRPRVSSTRCAASRS